MVRAIPMDSDIPPDIAQLRSEAASLRQEGVQLAAQLSAPVTAGPDLGRTFMEGAVTKQAAKLSKQWFGTTRHGSRLARQMFVGAEKQQANDLKAARQAQADTYVSRVQDLARRAGEHMSKNSRASLLRALADARAAAKPATAVRRAAGTAQRIEHLEPKAGQPPGQARRGTDYEALQRLESALRETIEAHLQRADANWWQNRVPAAARSQADKRLANNDGPWPWTPGVSADAIYFLDFPDYAEILCSEPNWTTSFEAVFGDREILRSKLRELQPIRRAIAHSRPLSEEQSAKVQLYSRELVRAMNAIR